MGTHLGDSPPPSSPGSLASMLGENHMPFPWRYAIALIIACFFAAMLVLPFEIEVDRLNADPEGTLVWKPEVFAIDVLHKDVSRPSYRWGPQLVIAAVVDRMLWPLLAIFVGLKLGPAVALAWPPMTGWGAGPRRFRRASSTLLLAVALGIASVIWLWISSLFLLLVNDEVKQGVLPAWWVGMLASLGAGVREEVMLRLGVMTTSVWILAKLTRQRVPGPATTWSGIVLASLLFGAMHIRQTIQLFGLTGPLIAYALLGNGGIGLIFGWLYWRKGLIAAMTSHTTQDVITKVIIPIMLK
jgi:Type II CAAX prenyl endopeptidase Rce1-like